MWADTLQLLERMHLLILLTWAAASVFIGSLMLAWLRSRNWQSPLLQQFSVQTTIWGAVEGALALLLLSRLRLRDLASASRLERILWLSIGLEIGFVLAGVAFIWSGTRVGQRTSLIGTGAGIVLQGAALATMDLTLAAQLSR